MFKAVILSKAILEIYIILQRSLVIKLRKQSYPYNYLFAAEKQIYLPVKETLIPLQNSYGYFKLHNFSKPKLTINCLCVFSVPVTYRTVKSYPV